MIPTVTSLARARRPALMVGAVVLAVAVGASGAWLTRAPEKAPPRVAKPSTARLAIVRAAPPVPTPVAPVVVPEAAAPPEPNAADFARAAPMPTAAAEAAEAAAPTPPTETAGPPAPVDWAAMPIDELRVRANADEVPAMEELARRLIQGVGVTRDQQAGAGWLLRAAQHGSAQSAFNVGVMYERGFVVERDSTKAIEWYRKGVEANLPMAKHNLALLLRDGKGAPRNGKEAIELLRSASRQGMTASMFSLGDIYERGDAVQKDPAMALAWFAIAAEFERQTNRTGESALAKTATQRAQALQRTLMPGDLTRAQQYGQSEFKQIVEALQPPKPPAAPPSTPAESASVAPPPDADPPGWPKAADDQIRVIQQALVELKFLRDKPDGVIGPLTRGAILAFQRSVGARETGEATKEIFVALQEAIAQRDAANAAMPEAKPEAAKPGAKAEPPKVEPKPPAVATIDLGKTEPPPAPPTSADIARLAATPGPKGEPPQVEAKVAPPKPAPAKPSAVPTIDLGTPEPPPASPTSVDFARPPQAKIEAPGVVPARVEPAKAEPVKEEPAKIDPTKVDPPKPPMPRIETAKPPATPVVAAAEPPRTVLPKPDSPTRIDLGKSDPSPAPPTSADIARDDPDAWPAEIAEQLKAIQRLLREINFWRDAPDGVDGPATRAAIRDYERTMGLPQTGEPSKALFESLKQKRSLMAPKPN
jgi:TPR repeat protein/peptidoglycan hydrolase-like protein with peptidoglycan-binding domain